MRANSASYNMCQIKGVVKFQVRNEKHIFWAKSTRKTFLITYGRWATERSKPQLEEKIVCGINNFDSVKLHKRA